MEKKAITQKRYIAASAIKGKFCISDKKMEQTDETEEGWKSESEVYTFQSVKAVCDILSIPYSVFFEIIRSMSYEEDNQIEVNYTIKTA